MILNFIILGMMVSTFTLASPSALEQGKNQLMNDGPFPFEVSATGNFTTRKNYRFNLTLSDYLDRRRPKDTTMVLVRLYVKKGTPLELTLLNLPVPKCKGLRFEAGVHSDIPEDEASEERPAVVKASKAINARVTHLKAEHAGVLAIILPQNCSHGEVEMEISAGDGYDLLDLPLYVYPEKFKYDWSRLQNTAIPWVALALINKFGIYIPTKFVKKHTKKHVHGVLEEVDGIFDKYCDRKITGESLVRGILITFDLKPINNLIRQINLPYGYAEYMLEGNLCETEEGKKVVEAIIKSPACTNPE